jgi:hypothetical protein
MWRDRSDETSEIINRVTSLALRKGVSTRRVWHKPNYGYENHTIYYTGVDASDAASNLCHDLAHWLVAEPQRRDLLDFGLGRGPDSVRHADRVVSVPDATQEEQASSILGALIERNFGGWPLVTLHKHNWSSRDLHIIDIMSGLEKKQLVRRSKYSSVTDMLSYILEFEVIL